MDGGGFFLNVRRPPPSAAFFPLQMSSGGLLPSCFGVHLLLPSLRMLSFRPTNTPSFLGGLRCPIASGRPLLTHLPFLFFQHPLTFSRLVFWTYPFHDNEPHSLIPDTNTPPPTLFFLFSIPWPLWVHPSI